MSCASAESSQTDIVSVLAASAGIGVFGLALGLTYPLLTLLLVAQGVAPHVIGLNAAAMGVGIVISTVTIPWLTARYSAGTLMVAGLLGAACMITGFALTDNVALWFALRIALGFCVNAVFVLTEAWVNAAASESVRGRAISAYTMALSAGFAIGPIGVTAFGTESALPFAVCAIIVALSAIGIALLSRRAKTSIQSAPKGSIRKFAIAAPVLVLMVMAFGFSDWTFISVMPLYFLEVGLDPAASALTVSILHFGMIAFAVPTGFALDRWPRMLIGIYYALGAAICFAALPYINSDNPVLWPVLLLLGGFTGGIYNTALTLLGERFSGGLLVAGSAVYSVAFTIAGTVGMMGSGGLISLVGHEFVPAVFAATFIALIVAMLVSRGRAHN